MRPLLLLAVVAAIVVPTALLGSTSQFRGFSVRQVERAFSASGIRLRPDTTNASPPGFADLVGRLDDRARLDVTVGLPPPTSQSGDVLVTVSSSASRHFWGSGERFNVIVDWTTARCADKRQVSAALDGLPLPPGVPTARSAVHCGSVPGYP